MSNESEGRMTSNTQPEALPPLPEADNCNFKHGRAGYSEPHWSPAYTADQMRAYAQQHAASLHAECEALRLAAECEHSAELWLSEVRTRTEAAAELRRLHADCEALRMAAEEEAKFANEARAECEALRAETIVVIDGHQIRLAEVLRRIIRGIDVKRGRMLWAAVHELTAHGSTVSAGLCRWAGLDPNTGTELAARAAIKEQSNE